MNELALFAGAGGGILGGKLLGWRTVCAVEWEAYPASVLCARQNDGLLPPFPIWDDVQTFDGKPWRGIVDVVSGGFPCQDISVAGSGDGLDGESSGMWREMARIIGEVRPRYAFVENSPMLVTRGLERVLADLTAMGYDSRWGVVSASDIGANHRRQRMWIVAHSRYGSRRDKRIAQRGEIPQGEWSANTNQVGRPGEQPTFVADTSIQRYKSPQKQICTGRDGFKHKDWWSVEPNVGRVADGVAARVDRLKAIGNGQVPLCAATAWRILNDQN
jgi:DNA (cytosine-5)-methyltransferase 1